MRLFFGGECLRMLTQKSLNFLCVLLALALHLSKMVLLFARRFLLHLLNGFLELLYFCHQRVLVLFFGPRVFFQLDGSRGDCHLQMFALFFTFPHKGLVLTHISLEVIENAQLFVQANQCV